MQSRINKVSAVVILVFISVLSVFLFFGKKEKGSDNENKDFSDAPEISWHSLYNGSFSEALDSYITEHFPVRKQFISLNAKIGSELSESIVNGVFVSGDMLLGMNDYDDDSIEQSASEINKFRLNYSGAVYFACIPTSSGVYSEKLPAYTDKNAESKKISSFYSKLGMDIRRIDAYNVLKMLNESYIFYRNDSRWTSYGAYCVYRTVIQKLGFSPTAFDRYTIDHITNNYRGNLYNLSQYSKTKADIIDIYHCDKGADVISCFGYDETGKVKSRSLYDKSELDSTDEYNVFLGKPLPLIRIKTSVNNSRKLLVITDNYGACFIPFLIQHYSEIAVITPSEIKGSLDSFIDTSAYEQALFLFGIDSLSESSIFESLNR